MLLELESCLIEHLVVAIFVSSKIIPMYILKSKKKTCFNKNYKMKYLKKY